VRPALADRLLRGWYAGDPRFHEAARREAELGYAGVRTPKDLEHAAPGYIVRAQPLDASEAGLQDREVGRLGPLEETDEAFTAEVLLSRSDEELRTAVASWPKVTFEAWWSAERERHAPILPEASNAARHPRPPGPLRRAPRPHLHRQHLDPDGHRSAERALRAWRRLDRDGDDRLGRSGRRRTVQPRHRHLDGGEHVRGAGRHLLRCAGAGPDRRCWRGEAKGGRGGGTTPSPTPGRS
jgi:hypothetical protein